MSTVRVVVRATTSNYDTFTEIAKRACAFVDEHEPGALAYECFANETNGNILWHEMYADEDAFLAHAKNFTTNGIIEDTMRVVEMGRPTILTRITDPRVREVATQFGATELHGLAGIVRQ
jgi:quinol monooxygenase YgiN